MKANAALFILLVFLSACGASEPETTVPPVPTATHATVRLISCFEIAPDFVNSVSTLVERWDDASALAASAAKVSLAGPVARLQAIRRDLRHLETPACGEEARTLILAHMDDTIDYYLDVMQDVPVAGNRQAKLNVSMIVATDAIAELFVKRWEDTG
jgi:hypothetical protein